MDKQMDRRRWDGRLLFSPSLFAGKETCQLILSRISWLFLMEISVANALRRIMIAEVPTMGKTEKLHVVPEHKPERGG